ncbi:efflux transporter outer membrane subunit [Polaromonas hydrogenivorans]|uniref:Efflux transporter outer membrane subunit n=1 Tax=Polaromonas hydrogenivorans TaxID=335476 RepID=A0AAU7LT39_9BURK
MPLQHPAFSPPRLALLALAALLSGCASPTSPTTALPATPTPAEWSTTAPYASSPANAASLANWWQGFNDPQLTALVTQALQNSTDVRSAQSALLQARALRDVSAAGLGPSVSTSASAQRSKSGGSQAGNIFQAGFDASWEPDVFGGNRSALNAAQSDLQAASASLANVQVSLAAETAVTYIELRGLQAQLLIARGNLASQLETLQITRWRAQAGLASSLDVEQGIAASEQTGAHIPALETSIAQAASSLAVLTGQSPGVLRSALATAAPVPQPANDLALAIPAETLRQRPDVRAAEHRIKAALARVAQADAARYPSFQISGSLGLRALTLGTLTGGASVANALLASVSVPLLDGGAARAQVRAQEAALESARISYEGVVLAALKDVEDALISLQGNRERLARLQAASGAAANADLLARQRYASGLIDFRAVLETQRTLLSTQDSLEATRASLSADHVRLYKALGGGWTRALETAAR